MSTHSSHSRAKHPFRGTTMKTITSLAAGAIMIAAAGAAAAQESLTLTGEAEAVCELPDAWQFISASSGGASGQFDAGVNAWTIPSELLSNAEGMGVQANEVAIRIRGVSFCNTAHTIELRSQNGGLVADAGAAPGFANRRTMRYDAYWGDGNGNSYGGGGRVIANFVPTTPGQVRTANYTVTDTMPPPGLRAFDIRMSLLRNAANIPAQPLVAGAYQDVITVTLTPVS